MVAFASKMAEKMIRQYGLFGNSIVKTPSVSVVMPAYNEAGYIGDAVKSALNQGYKPLEVLVVDDCSTDGTGEIAKKAGANVYMTKNSGVSTARNYGMHKASGDIVLFMDADSEMPCNAIERAVESVRRGYVAGSFSKSSGNPTDDMFNGYTTAVNSILTPARNIFGNIPASGSGTLMYVRSDVAKRNGLRFNEGQESREDSDFISDMSEYGFVDFISDVTVKTSARRSEGKSVLSIAAEKTRSYLKPFGNYGHVEGARSKAA